jgi:signal transduction histidine kinase/ActR/RegA family two-component response regulator
MEPADRDAERATEHTPGGAISFEDGGRIVSASAALHRMMHIEPGTLVGRSFDRLLTPAARVYYSTHVSPLLRLQNALDEVYLQLRLPSGEDLDVLVSATREIEAGRALNHCALIPMKQRKRLEEALLESKRQAEAATLAKDQFLAVVSHELRSPLSAIMGWAQVGSSDKSSAEARSQAFKAIERNAASQAHLIDDLLDVSRIVSGKLRLSPRPVELGPVIEIALDNARPAALTKNISLVASLDTASNIVLADPDRIQQVAWNLLTNAIKFTPKGGRIQITLKRVDSQVQFGVADSGAGIPASQLPFVFERFWQADGNANVKAGLGLGLSICKSLVELHGGNIHVDSAGPGQGSVFSVELPLAVAATGLLGTSRRASDLTGEHALATSLDGLHILVIDDDPDTRGMMKVLLETAGATIALASDYDSAVEILQARVPDVLLSDIGLQGRDGFELMRMIRSGAIDEARNVPAIAITGLARSEDRIAILRAGFQACLIKPLVPAELTAMVRTLVRARL